MKLIDDYHIHTYYSDGTQSVQQMVQACVDAHLRCIALTDHGSGHIAHGVRRTAKKALFADIEAARERYGGRITILRGIEANLMGTDGRIDLKEDELKEYDIILLGFHKTAVTFKSALHFHVRSKLPLSSEYAKELTTKAYIKAMQRYPIDIIVHPNYAVKVDVAALAVQAAKSHVALEINGHINRMSKEELIAAKEAGAFFTINSDAHKTAHIGRTDRAIEDALAAGIGGDLVANTSCGPRLKCFERLERKG
ncbi:MAG: PHP domain-containing protein [Christensenellales bacterium]|jgi:putative hydrolase